MSAQQKDIKRLLKDLARQGWTWHQGRKHIKAYHPKGGFIVMAVSPSCPFAYKNILTEIRKLEKANSQKVAA